MLGRGMQGTGMSLVGGRRQGTFKLWGNFLTRLSDIDTRPVVRNEAIVES